MTTVGEILYRKRIAKNLTLAQVEKAIKIRAKFLEALEKNEFERLPPGTFVKGFIKNYASFLGIPSNEALAFYRRQVSEETPKVLPSGRSHPLMRKFSFTPQSFTTVSIVLLILVFFGYMIFSYLKYAGAPTLSISSPNNNVVVHEEQVFVSGQTDPNTILTINGQVVPINESGHFQIKVPLQAGLNTLAIVSTNKFKRQTTVTRNLRLEK